MKKIRFFGFGFLVLMIGLVNVMALEIDHNLKLEEDLNEVVVVKKDSNVVIDLNGHNITVTGSGVDAISNYGTLTVKGSGVVTATGAAFINYPGATAILDNGEYLSNGWYTIKNMGTMTINNMKFGNNVNNGSSLIVNGYYGNAANDRGQVEGDTVMMTINGGTFENHNNSCNVVKNDDFGKLVIEGGTFIASSNDTSNANPVVQNWHKATINNGTFTSKNGVVLANGFLDQTADAGEFVINGGTFTGKTGIFGTNGGAVSGKGVLTIKGGTFFGDATVSNVYTTVIEGGVFDDDRVSPDTNSGFESYDVIGSDTVVIAKESELVDNVEASVVSENDIDQETLTLIKDVVKTEEKKIAALYDIELFKSVSGLNVQQISDATDKVKVTLNFPDNLEKVKDGYIRKYYMIRVHDNKTDILDVVVGDNNTFSFETDKFSTYALAYKDVVKTVSSPNTFDGGIVYIITLLFGFGLLLFSNKYLKRFN